MGINSDTKDTELTKLIGAVNSFIPSYCNRDFTDYYATNKVEFFDGTLKEYYPEVFPIISVVSMEYSSLSDGVYDKTLDLYTDYIIDDLNSRIVALGDQFIYTGVPYNSIKLTYKGGYDRVPEDIKLAAVHLVEYYMEDGYVPRKSLAGASIDTVIIPDGTAKLPPHIRIVLEHHKAQVL